MENNTTFETPTPETNNTNAYVVDARTRAIPVEFADHKFRLVHEVKAPDRKDLQRYFLNAPSLRSVSEEEMRSLGSPEAPAADLHDLVCDALRRESMTGELQREYSLVEIRELVQRAKAEAIGVYLFGYYDVELKSASGEMDDILFGRESKIEAIVKVRPTGKVEQTFKIFLTRPNDLNFSRFTSQSHGTATIDPKRDTLLMEYLGDDALGEMTSGEDEGNRVIFQKTTKYVRSFFDIIDKSFAGAENVTFEGRAYDPQTREQFLAKLDPVLKVQLADALRNFI